MPRIERNADIVWEGNVARGAGRIAPATGAFAELPFTLASRVAEPEGKTSPEELLAAALELDVVDDYDGVRTVAFPAHLSETPASTRRRPPALDEHGAELRDELSARSARPRPPA